MEKKIEVIRAPREGIAFVIRTQTDVELKYEEFIVPQFPTCCSECPVGFQFILGKPCGRNTPYKSADYHIRPKTCQLRLFEFK